MGTVGLDSSTPRALPPVDPRRGPRDAIGVQFRIRGVQLARTRELHLPTRGRLVGPDPRLPRGRRYRRVLLRTSLGASPSSVCAGRDDVGSEWALLWLPRAPRHVGHVMGGLAVRRGRARLARSASILVGRVVRSHSRSFHLRRQSTDRSAHPDPPRGVHLGCAPLAHCRLSRKWTGPSADRRSGCRDCRRSSALCAARPPWSAAGKRLCQEFGSFRHRGTSLAGSRHLLPRLLGATNRRKLYQPTRFLSGGLGVCRGHCARPVRGRRGHPLAPSGGGRTHRRDAGGSGGQRLRTRRPAPEQGSFHWPRVVGSITHSIGVLPGDARRCGPRRCNSEVGTATGRTLGPRGLRRDRCGPRSGVALRERQPPLVCRTRAR